MRWLFILFVSATLGLAQPLIQDPAWQAVVSYNGGGSIYHADVVAWSNRVVTLGGAGPSTNTMMALTTFWNGISDITNKLVMLNPMVPDNLTACLTPLYANAGGIIWTNSGFTNGNLSVDGLAGGGSRYIDLGIIPANTIMATNDHGFTIYNFTAGTQNSDSWGCRSGDVTRAFAGPIEYGNSLQGLSLNGTPGTGKYSASVTNLCGYISWNRIATNDYAIYTANSTNAHVARVTGTSFGGLMPTNYCALYNIRIDASSFGTTSSRTYSFCAMHRGLTSSESTNFFARIQTLRQTLGGGYK